MSKSEKKVAKAWALSILLSKWVPRTQVIARDA